jgi:hypothetical protein
MKTTFAFILWIALTAGIFVQNANALVTVTGSTGTNSAYARLALAFTAINCTAQTGNTSVTTITASTTGSTSTNIVNNTYCTPAIRFINTAEGGAPVGIRVTLLPAKGIAYGPDKFNMEQHTKSYDDRFG